MAATGLCGFSRPVSVVVALLVPALACAQPQQRGRIEVHTLESPFQAAATSLRVLLPKSVAADRLCRVLYVLPVHQDGQYRHGDGLRALQQLDLPAESPVICVAPAFTSEPWYADHDQNPARRDESHLLRTVIPFVESRYPVQTNRQGRLLIGFSKSGWGALTLLLRHPERFHRAAAWDPGIRIDTGPRNPAEDRSARIRAHFGSDNNFERYRLSTLLQKQGSRLGHTPRLFYFNCEGTARTAGGKKLHQLMRQQGIAHRYVLGQLRPHRWDSGWLPDAVQFLLADDGGRR